MSTSAARQTYHHRDLRAALLREAVGAVDSGGAGAFSLREAARSLGVSPAAAYRHFASKADLMAAVIDGEFDELADDIDAAWDAVRGMSLRDDEARAAGMVLAAATIYVRRALRHPERFHLALGAARDEIGPGEQRTRDISSALRVGLVESGAITPAMLPAASWTIWPAVHGLASLAADGWLLDEPQCDEGARAVVETVLRGLGVPEKALGQMDRMAPVIARPSNRDGGI